MFREKPRPVDDADAAMLRAIAAADVGGLADNAGRNLPPALAAVLEPLLQGEDDALGWANLGKALVTSGMVASALAAYSRIPFISSDYTHWIEAYEAKAALERRLRMDGAAAIDLRVAARLRGETKVAAPMPELELDTLFVQAAMNDPEGHDRLFRSLGDCALLDDPFRDPLLAKRNFFSPVVCPGQFACADASFFVLDAEGAPVLLVEADVFGHRHLGCRESAIVITRLSPAHPELAAAEGLATRQLRTAAEWCGCPSLLFERREDEPLAPALTLWLLEDGTVPIPLTRAWIDLTLSQDEIERSFRDSHRQSVRWGLKSIEIAVARGPDEALIDAYVQVHMAAARPLGVALDALRAYLSEGLMTLYVGFYEGEPAVALLASRHGRTTYYWASVKLSRGNKPLGHVVLHRAIMDAKAEGQTRFDLGALQEDERFSPKLRNIALYKRGFANRFAQIHHQAAFVGD